MFRITRFVLAALALLALAAGGRVAVANAGTVLDICDYAESSPYWPDGFEAHDLAAQVQITSDYGASPFVGGKVARLVVGPGDTFMHTSGEHLLGVDYTPWPREGLETYEDLAWYFPSNYGGVPSRWWVLHESGHPPGEPFNGVVIGQAINHVQVNSAGSDSSGVQLELNWRSGDVTNDGWGFSYAPTVQLGKFATNTWHRFVLRVAWGRHGSWTIYKVRADGSVATLAGASDVPTLQYVNGRAAPEFTAHGSYRNASDLTNTIGDAGVRRISGGTLADALAQFTKTASSGEPAPSSPSTTYTIVGKTTVGATREAGGAGYLDASGPYTVERSASYFKLVGYVAGGDAPSSLRAAIYADDGSGEPGALVAVSRPVGVAAWQKPGWVIFPLPAAVTLPAGRFWVAYWYGGSSAYVYYDVVEGAERYLPLPYSATGDPSSPFGRASSSHSAYSLFAIW